MSLQTAGVWQADVWEPTVWGDGVWREGAYNAVISPGIEYAMPADKVHYQLDGRLHYTLPDDET